MQAPMLVDAPVLFPGRCMFCSRSTGRMVDTHIDDPDAGRVYACVEVCVPSFAALAGWAAPEIVAAKDAASDVLRSRLAAAEALLEQNAADTGAIVEQAAVRAVELSLARQTTTKPARATAAA